MLFYSGIVLSKLNLLSCQRYTHGSDTFHAFSLVSIALNDLQALCCISSQITVRNQKFLCDLIRWATSCFYHVFKSYLLPFLNFKYVYSPCVNSLD